MCQRLNSRIAVALVGFAVLALAALAPAKTSAPTGDAQAIAFYQQVRQAYATVPGVKVFSRGFLFARQKGTRFHYVFGHRPAGYHPATETVYFALANERQAAYLDKAVAPHVGRFSILVNSSGVFLDGACWAKQRNPSRAAPYGPAGSHFLSQDPKNRYYPLEHRGSLVLGRFTYPFGRRLKATEVDTIDPTTHYILSQRITVRKLDITITARLKTLGTAPTIPTPAPACRHG